MMKALCEEPTNSGSSIFGIVARESGVTITRSVHSVFSPSGNVEASLELEDVNNRNVLLNNLSRMAPSSDPDDFVPALASHVDSSDTTWDEASRLSNEQLSNEHIFDPHDPRWDDITNFESGNLLCEYTNSPGTQQTYDQPPSTSQDAVGQPPANSHVTTLGSAKSVNSEQDDCPKPERVLIQASELPPKKPSDTQALESPAADGPSLTNSLYLFDKTTCAAANKFKRVGLYLINKIMPRPASNTKKKKKGVQSTSNSVKTPRTAKSSNANKNICRVCKKMCKTRQSRWSHELYIHTNPEEYRHVCSQCSKKFPTPTALKRHIEIHTIAKTIL